MHTIMNYSLTLSLLPLVVCVLRCLTLLILAGADVNAKEEFTTPFKMAQKKHMRSFDGTC